MAFTYPKGGKRETKVVNLIGADGFHVVGHRLEADNKVTRVRILPGYDENGMELPAFNPDIADEQDLDSLVTFATRVSVVRDLGWPESYSFIDYCQFTNDGREIDLPISPAYRVISRLRAKLYDWQFLKEHVNGRILTNPTQYQLSDCPESWIKKWMGGLQPMGNLTRPADFWVMRCFVLQENGEKVVDGNGKDSYIAKALLCVSEVAFKTFIKTALTRLDPTQPFSFENSGMNDFVSSANGAQVVYQRTTTVTRAGQQGRTSYSLNALKQPWPITPAMLENAWMPWENTLNFMGVEDQVDLLIRMLGPEVVDFGLRPDFRDEEGAFYAFCPENIRGMANGVTDGRYSDAILESLGFSPDAAREYLDNVKAQRDAARTGTTVPQQQQQQQQQAQQQQAPTRFQGNTAPGVNGPATTPARRPMPAFPAQQTQRQAPPAAPLVNSPIPPATDDPADELPFSDETAAAEQTTTLPPPPPTGLSGRFTNRPQDPSAAGFQNGLQNTLRNNIGK